MCVATVKVEVLLEHDWSKSAWEASLLGAAQNLHPDVVIALLHKRSFLSTEVYRMALHHAIKQKHVSTIVALASNVASSNERRRHCLKEGLSCAAASQQVRLG